MAAQNMNLEQLIGAGEEKGFKVEQDVDYGAGPIDIVWNINVHSALPNIKCGQLHRDCSGKSGRHS